MEIILNGEKKNIPDGSNLPMLIETLSYPPNTFAVAINKIFVPRSQYAKKIIIAGDQIEIVMPMQGG